MTKRAEGGVTYTQSFDVETRLPQVTASGGCQVTQFAHDASGQRFRTEVAPANLAANDSRTVTTYPFPHYEVEQAYTWQYNCTGGCSWKYSDPQCKD